MATCPNCGNNYIKAEQRACVLCGYEFVRRLEGASHQPISSPTPSKKSITIMKRLASWPVTQSPRELGFHLGVALSKQARHTEAVDTLERALKEEGSTPSTVDILLQLANAFELAGSTERALRSYLQAVRGDPNLAEEILTYAHKLMTPELALGLGSWVTREWAVDVTSIQTTALNRMHIALFICRVNVYLGDYEKAVEFLEHAKEATPENFSMVAVALLAPETFLQALTMKRNGNVYYALAQVYQALERPRQVLALVNEALELGLSDQNQYPETPAQQLKAEVLEMLGEHDEAATWYYEAGRGYFWRNENATAVNLLERAASLKPDHAPTYWYWMEALRMVSYQQEFPYVNAEAAKAALRVWEAGVLIAKQAGQEMDAIPGPDRDFVWVYSSRALLNEQLARLPNAEAYTLGWEAVTYLERALMLSGQDAYYWAYLGRFHRSLLNQACALQATQKAVGLGPENAAALEERAIILSNIGEAPDARKELKKRRQLDANPNVWLDAVEAFNLLLSGPYPEALALLNNAVKVAPDDLWFLELRATCYRMMDDWSSATEDSQRIWSRYDPRDTNNQNFFAWAAYFLRQPAAARDIFERLLEDRNEAGYAHRGLGLCALALDELESAEHHLEVGIAQAANVRELDELLLSDFKTTEHLARSWPHRAHARAVLNRFVDKIRSRRRELEQPRSAEAELSDVVIALTQNGAEVSWAWLGAHAGLARLQGEAGRWSEAAVTYQLLLKETTLFPEAGVGLANALDKLQEAGKDLLRAGEPLAALEQLTTALTLTETSKANDIERHAELHSRLGLTHFSLADQAEARSHFLLALQNYRAKGAESPGERLAESCRLLILKPSQYWALRDEWQFLSHAPETEARDRADLLVARSSLASYLDEAFELTESTTSEIFIPVVTPILLQVGDSLVPKVDSRQDGGKFLYEDIPAMRERFEKNLGVRVPGVRARSYVGAVNANKYHIMLDEASFAIGSVELNMGYCPAPPDKLQSIGVPNAVIVPAIDPVTGNPGGWIPRDHWDTVASHGLSVWTETAFIIAHLEAILRRNLTMFLGVQEVETLLAEWEKTDHGSALIATVLSQPLLRLRFARLLRELVKEQVAILAWKEILEVVGETGLEDLDQAVLRVRLRLKWLLPGNHSSARRIELPAEWEDKLISWLRRENGRAFWEAPPEESLQLLSDLRGLLQSRDTNTVIVVRNATLRPFVRRLLESEFPNLMVLAQEELLSEDEMVAGEGEPRAL
jgi:tetratricopeptide (TPR) repeat protein